MERSASAPARLRPGGVININEWVQAPWGGVGPTGASALASWKYPDTIRSDVDCRGVRPNLDLALYASLLRRHRWLVSIGVLASLALAFLSFVRVSPSGVTYRKPQVWSNQSTVLVSQQGFQEGRSAGAAVAADPGLQRATALVQTYAALVESDEVANLLAKRGLITRADVVAGNVPVVATPVVSSNGLLTPLMTIAGSGTTPAKATAMTVGATKAFIDTLERQQKQAGIPPSRRVVIQVVRRFSEATLSQPRSKSLTIVILMAGLSATFAAAFIRDRDSRRRDIDARAAGGSLPIHAAPATEPEPASPGRRRAIPRTALGAEVPAEEPTPRLSARLRRVLGP